MTVWRGSYLFFQQGYGWSESWDWDDQVPGNLDPAGAATQFALLEGPRMALSANNTYMNGIRISTADSFRDVALKDFAGTGNVGVVGAYTGSAPPATALLTKHNPRTFGLPSSYRPLRGLPQSMVQNGGIWTPTGPWSDSYTAYKQTVRNLNLGWIGLRAQLTADVVNVAQTPNAQTITVTIRPPFLSKPVTTPATTIPLNTRITLAISGVQGATQVNGRHIFTTSDGLNFVTVKKLAINPYVAGGRVLFSAKGFILDAGTGQTLRIDERKPGRPFYLSAGRKRGARAA